MCSSLFFSSFLFFSVSVKTQILVKYFFADSLHNFFSLLQQKIVSEIRTILIFHFFTDKSVAYVQIRPHYYTVFPAFPQQILSRKKFFKLLSSNFLSSFPNICQIREPRKVEFFQITFLHSMDSHCVCSNDCTQFNTDREFV